MLDDRRTPRRDHADGLQHLLSRAKWDAEAVRDDLRDYVIDAFGDPGAILVLDETGDEEGDAFGRGAAPVHRHRRAHRERPSGGVSDLRRAAWAPPDRPRPISARCWAENPDRCDGAGIPPDKRGFATKPALAGALLARAVAAKVPAAWVAADEVYGADPALRAAIRGHGLGYVLASRPTGVCPPPPARCASIHPGTAAQPGLAETQRRRRSHGPASTPGRGSRCCPEDDTDTGHHHLLIRRNDATGELAYLRCYAPHPVTLHTLVTVAGQRRRIEESFQAAKGLTGLDQHQVRRWTSWHRWTTLAMLAHAFLAVATATERDTQPPPEGLITLTVNEFRRLFDALLLGRSTP